MKKTFISIVLLAAFAAGCTPKPSAPIVPTPDINAIVGTMMAATLTAIAPTPAPPTETPAPVPTSTPLPPGTLSEEFSASFTYPNPEYWSDPIDVSQVKHTLNVSVGQDSLIYNFVDPETYQYTFYQKEMPADVVIETSYLNTTTQNSEASIVCRVDPQSRAKWYEFRIIHFERAGVIYYFERKDIYQNNPYQRLAYKKLPVELYKDKENRLEARCQGNKLTLSLNGQEVVSVEDTKLPGGGLVGLGGVSHSKVPMTISYSYLNVVPAH
jgi:hypothetical protein